MLKNYLAYDVNVIVEMVHKRLLKFPAVTGKVIMYSVHEPGGHLVIPFTQTRYKAIVALENTLCT